MIFTIFILALAYLNHIMQLLEIKELLFQTKKNKDQPRIKDDKRRWIFKKTSPHETTTKDIININGFVITPMGNKSKQDQSTRRQMNDYEKSKLTRELIANLEIKTRKLMKQL